MSTKDSFYPAVSICLISNVAGCKKCFASLWSDSIHCVPSIPCRANKRAMAPPLVNSSSGLPKPVIAAIFPLREKSVVWVIISSCIFVTQLSLHAVFCNITFILLNLFQLLFYLYFSVVTTPPYDVAALYEACRLYLENWLLLCLAWVYSSTHFSRSSIWGNILTAFHGNLQRNHTIDRLSSYDHRIYSSQLAKL